MGLAIIVGLTQPNAGDSAIGGAVTILGALDYRSVKRRRLGIKPNTYARQEIEIAMGAAALLLIG